MTLERFRASLADRYRIERELGRGGMATVYLALDLMHGRKVAIKVSCARSAPSRRVGDGHRSPPGRGRSR